MIGESGTCNGCVRRAGLEWGRTHTGTTAPRYNTRCTCENVSAWRGARAAVTCAGLTTKVLAQAHDASGDWNGAKAGLWCGLPVTTIELASASCSKHAAATARRGKVAAIRRAFSRAPPAFQVFSAAADAEGAIASKFETEYRL